ncbi:hypothetical protein M8J77_008566 [Diaphorina citri]|nr:hypothetical protein M8J77_008566 [Diaphorina citri]
MLGIDYQVIFDFESTDDDSIDAALKDKFISREFQIFSSLDYLENSRYSRDGLLLDVACPHVKKFLLQCSKKHLFTSKNFYLLINSTAMKLNTHAITRNTTTFLVENENLHKKMTNYLNELACLLDCHLVYTVLYYHRPKYNIRFKFYEIYRVKVKQEFHSYLLMFGSNIYKDWMPPYRRHFHGARLKTASVILEQHDSSPDLETARFLNSDYSATYHYPIIKALSEGLNFTIDVDIFNDYGFMVNGKMSGLVSKLSAGYYDLAATGLIMKSDRLSMLYFLADTLQMKTAIMFRQPPLVSVSNIYFMAFSLQVWLCIVACLLVGSVVLQIQVSILRRIHADHSMSHETFADRVTYVWAALCQQGTQKVAQSSSVKISMFTILLTALFLFYPYSANITSLLQTPGKAFNSLDEIVASPLKILVHDMPYSKHILEDNNSSLIRKVYHEKIIADQPELCGVFVNIETGVEKVRSGLYGFQADVLLGYTEIERKWTDKEKCLLDQIGFLVVPRSAIPVPPNSGYKEVFRQFLRWEREVGILSYSRQRYLQPKPKCTNLASSSYLTIGLTEFWPALRILLYGMIVSLLVYLAEMVYFFSMYKGEAIIQEMVDRTNILAYAWLKRKLRKKGIVDVANTFIYNPNIPNHRLFYGK